MSTKTLRKRIALVAVAGLGFGLLSATTASAADLSAAGVTIKTPTPNSLEIVGVCAIAPSAQDATLVSTGTVVATGASLGVTVTTSGTGTIVLSGPAVWSASGGADVDATGTKLSSVTSSGTKTLKTTGVGAVTVTVKTAAGSTVKTIGIAVVASCATATTAVPANTVLNIDNDNAAATGIDEDLDYVDQAYTSEVWVNIALRNAYKAPVSAGILTATATNGALIAFTTPGNALTSTAFAATAAAAGDNLGLVVKQDTVTNPGKALTTTITFAFNGVTVGTKTVTIFGVPSSITVSKVVGGITDETDGTFDFVTKDNAGNSVESPDAANIDWEIAGFEAGDILDDVTATADYDSDFTTKGKGKFVCHTGTAKSSGSVDVAIGFLDSALNLVKSNTFKAACGGFADTFTVALDKAVYSTGEIATLTITAKDANGAPVGDNSATGEGTTVDLGGMSPIGTAATADDAFSGGVKTYKFRVDQNLGSFVGQAKVQATTDLTVKTVQYKIVSSDTGVGLNDVLKAMVSLIASINKQIAALQKALLKKK